RARVHALREMVDRAAGDRIAFAYCPFDRGDTAMPRQQRGMVADAAEARLRERFLADAGVSVGGDDEIGPVEDRRSRHEHAVVEDHDIEPCRLARLRQPVVGVRRDHARDLEAFRQQALERCGSEIARTNQRDLHSPLSWLSSLSLWWARAATGLRPRRPPGRIPAA